ncbi:MAG: nicotinate-nucleotide adenylyltransferase [Candidatus Aminicenantes bacterium]|nr:nicotinate-nucleotide adenylyltransferase [Candidatus Aminicenantes bacterium]
MHNKKIGLLGGTFNPVHYGHLKAAQQVIERFHLHKILFVPSYDPPHKTKKHIISPAHRYHMVKLAVSDYPSFEPSRIEIDAKEKSYSIVTLQKIKKSNPESRIFFILGVDAFLEIETWKDYKDLLESCSFIVISRPGYDLKDAKEIIGGKFQTKMLEVSSDVGEQSLEQAEFFLLHMKSLDLASSDIRERSHKGKSIHGMVPKEVENYIKENRLYS